MVKELIFFLLVLFVFGLSAQSAPAIETSKTPKFPTLKTNKPILRPPNEKTPNINLKPPGEIFRQCSPDPAITNIHIGAISTREERPGFYTIDVNGEVINGGQEPRWITARIKQGGNRFPVVPATNFGGQLTPDRSGHFSFRISHVSSSADFIPEYTVTIEVSGPDCNPQNNQKIITGAEISAAIAAYGRSRMQITRVRACVRPGRGVVIDGHDFGSRSPRYTALFGIRSGEILTWTDRQLIIKAPTELDPDLPMLLTLHNTNQPSSAIMASFGVRTCPSSQGESADATPADFKFGTMTSPADHSHARGVRPLLVILAPNGLFGANPKLAHGVTYYDRKIFGPGYPNVVDFYKVNSYFLPSIRGDRGFSWSKAAIVGPVITHLEQSMTTGRKLPMLKLEAAKSGFDFSRYDRNRDGRVAASELGLLIIENFSTGGGQTVSTKSCTKVPVPGSTKMIDVCTGGSYVGHDANISTIAHELSHLLGTIDIYGTTCLSQGLSLMTCTGYVGALPNPKPDQTFLLDPWHRSRLGWLKPRIYSLTDAGSALLRESSELYGESYNGGPIILYDPRKGTQEYFILEYRGRQGSTRVRGSTSSIGYGYDADAPEDGVAVWHVKTDAAGNLISIPDRVPESVNHRCARNQDANSVDGGSRVTNRRIPVVGLSCGDVMSNVHISPGRGGLPFGWGGHVLLQQRDGDISLNWLNSTNDGDGDDVGIHLKVYDEANGYLRIRWDPRR